MTVNKKVTGTASSMAGGLALGAAISLGVTLIGAWISAFLIAKETLAESSIGYCAMVIIFLGALVGSSVAIGRIKTRRGYVCAASGAIYYGLLLSMTALFFGGQYTGMGVTALIVLAACGTVLLMGLKQGRGAASRRHKIRHR